MALSVARVKTRKGLTKYVFDRQVEPVANRKPWRCIRVHAPPLQTALAAERIVQKPVRSAARCRRRHLDVKKPWRCIRVHAPPLLTALAAERIVQRPV